MGDSEPRSIELLREFSELIPQFREFVENIVTNVLSMSYQEGVVYMSIAGLSDITQSNVISVLKAKLGIDEGRARYILRRLAEYGLIDRKEIKGKQGRTYLLSAPSWRLRLVLALVCSPSLISITLLPLCEELVMLGTDEQWENGLPKIRHLYLQYIKLVLNNLSAQRQGDVDNRARKKRSTSFSSIRMPGLLAVAQYIDFVTALLAAKILIPGNQFSSLVNELRRYNENDVADLFNYARESKSLAKFIEGHEDPCKLLLAIKSSITLSPSHMLLVRKLLKKQTVN